MQWHVICECEKRIIEEEQSCSLVEELEMSFFQTMVASDVVLKRESQMLVKRNNLSHRIL